MCVVCFLDLETIPEERSAQTAYITPVNSGGRCNTYVCGSYLRGRPTPARTTLAGMSPNIAAALLLFLVGGFVGVFFLIARSKSEQETKEIDPNFGQSTSSQEIGDTVMLAMAVIGLFAALIGLVLLVDAVG